MNIYYSIMERMVLETLQVRTQTIQEIQLNTSLSRELLDHLLKDLITQNLIIIQYGKYGINKKTNSSIKSHLTNPNSVVGEVSEIVTSCLKNKADEKDSFNLMKVSMTEREEKIYKGLVYNLESFLKSLKRDEDVKNHKVVFWGGGVYENIKNSIMFN